MPDDRYDKVTYDGRSVSATAWNGPICPTCGARYLGSHACSQEDILRRVRELLALLTVTPKQGTFDRMGGCPCRTENGGSGVCGCVLSGPTVTCSARS